MPRDVVELRKLMDTMRSLSVALLGQRRFGRHAPDVVLLIGVAISDMEARAMTANKLALYAGMPRPTAVRRLKHLEAKGLVKRQPDGAFTLTPRALRRLAGSGSA